MEREIKKVVDMGETSKTGTILGFSETGDSLTDSIGKTGVKD